MIEDVFVWDTLKRSEPIEPSVRQLLGPFSVQQVSLALRRLFRLATVHGAYPGMFADGRHGDVLFEGLERHRRRQLLELQQESGSKGKQTQRTTLGPYCPQNQRLMSTNGSQCQHAPGRGHQSHNRWNSACESSEGASPYHNASASPTRPRPRRKHCCQVDGRCRIQVPATVLP